MSGSTLQGGCLCGAVRFEATSPFRRMVHCHCSRCRRSTGTGHATNIAVDSGQFAWLSGESAISRFDLPGAERFGKWFCSHCGCPLPRRSRDGSFVMIPAGSLDAAPPILPGDHIFWGSRVEWGCPSGGIPTHDTYPDGWG
ncbi:GFA family protein [Marilutibacter aestuarii]|uniref:GFA family protein n=1 Tax=Marilutibacter aestuarii TaxID=1706195 RepID=A0A508AIS1_9GAMM|nr:GFA family protein [Lysobacter aestuarii]TQD49709.1 GFA family protein [Lysobacter aestuarii]